MRQGHATAIPTDPNVLRREQEAREARLRAKAASDRDALEEASLGALIASV